MKSLVKLFAITTLIISGASSATIIDNNQYTTDTSSGLDWLDVSATVNQPYHFVSSQLNSTSSSLFGWRYATGSEFNALLSNITGSSILNTDYSAHTVADGSLASAQAMLGITHSSIAGQTLTTRSTGLLSDLSPLGAPLTFRWLGSIYVDSFNNTSNYFEAHYQSVSEFSSSPVFGSWLVRASSTVTVVPEPSIIALFSLGLIGFGFKNRKNRA